MRIAILADIHGNLPALEAVLTDLTTQAPDAVYLAGDQINRCPWNNEVMALCHAQGWPAIYGNHEWIVAQLGTPECHPALANRTLFSTLWWTRDHLEPRYLQEIRALPPDLLLIFDAGPPIRIFHGLPDRPFEGIYPNTDDATITQALSTIEEPTVICAHTHQPLIRQVGRWQILNGGSVGLPYNRDPRAQYLVLDGDGRHWHPTLRQVEYNRALLPEGFRTSGMLSEIGKNAELHLRTAMSGEPWSSDFGYWLRQQGAERQSDMDKAVEIYLQKHGPGRWAFELADK